MQFTSLTKRVPRAVRDNRERSRNVSSKILPELLRRTRGCWTKGDGLSYQEAAREEWARRR